MIDTENLKYEAGYISDRLREATEKGLWTFDRDSLLSEEIPAALDELAMYQRGTRQIQDTDIERILSSMGAVTEETWINGGFSMQHHGFMVSSSDGNGQGKLVGCIAGEGDAEFVIHARQDIPALCRELRRLIGIIVRLGGDVNDAR